MILREDCIERIQCIIRTDIWYLLYRSYITVCLMSFNCHCSESSGYQSSVWLWCISQPCSTWSSISCTQHHNYFSAHYTCVCMFNNEMMSCHKTFTLQHCPHFRFSATNSQCYIRPTVSQPILSVTDSVENRLRTRRGHGWKGNAECSFDEAKHFSRWLCPDQVTETAGLFQELSRICVR